MHFFNPLFSHCCESKQKRVTFAAAREYQRFFLSVTNLINLPADYFYLRKI